MSDEPPALGINVSDSLQASERLGPTDKPKPPAFRIYYDDGSIYEGDPFKAPGLGILCILDSHDQLHIDENADYYIWMWREDGWTAVNYFGLFDYLQAPGPKKVLFGRLVNNKHFEEIHLRAYREMLSYDQS